MSQPLSADHANLLLNVVFLPALQREQPTTRQVIEAIPLDKGDYRPDAVSKTALELAWHIAVAEKRFFNGIADGGFDFSPIPARIRSRLRPTSDAGTARCSILFTRACKK